MDYKLMVVTEGTLYITDHEKKYAVAKGEYLLMGPTSFQHGTKSSGCSFYWLHFEYHKELQDHKVIPILYDSSLILIPKFIIIVNIGSIPDK